MSGSHSIEWHREVGAISDDWRALARSTGAAPFVWPEWIEAWYSAFGDGEPAVVTARRQTELRAILPLERRGGVLASPTNWHTPLFGALGEGADAIQPLLEGVLDDGPRRLSLEFVDSTDPLLALTRQAAEAAGYRCLEQTVLRSPYLDLEGGWEECWASLGSKRRNSLKRRRRRLEERGPVELEVVTGGSGLSEALEEALRIEALGWKGRAGTAINSQKSTAAFYRKVTLAAADLGALRLALLRVGEALVAFDLAVECGETHYLVKTGFDPGFRESAPGMVLRTMMIERSCESGIRTYEFLGGPDHYKLDWTDRIHERLRLHAFAPSVGGLAHLTAFRWGRPLAKKALGLRRRSRG